MTVPRLTRMTPNATRMLLLGAVAMFEPVNGYQIRRELVSWQVDRWAHVNPGSIYNGLGTLTRQGLLARTDVVDGTREVAIYEITDAGAGRAGVDGGGRGPAWLQQVSDFMPFRWIVDGVRHTFVGDRGQHPDGGTAWAAVLFGLSVWWGTAVFRREHA